MVEGIINDCNVNGGDNNTDHNGRKINDCNGGKNNQLKTRDQRVAGAYHCTKFLYRKLLYPVHYINALSQA